MIFSNQNDIVDKTDYGKIKIFNNIYLHENYLYVSTFLEYKYPGDCGFYIAKLFYSILNIPGKKL